MAGQHVIGDDFQQDAMYSYISPEQRVHHGSFLPQSPKDRSMPHRDLNLRPIFIEKSNKSFFSTLCGFIIETHKGDCKETLVFLGR
jgi:hypothetical protein